MIARGILYCLSALTRFKVCACVAFCNSISRLSSRLVYSRLVYSRLVYSRLVYSRLVYSRLVYSRLVYSRLVYSRLVYSRLVYSRLVYSRLVYPFLLLAMCWYLGDLLRRAPLCLSCIFSFFTFTDRIFLCLCRTLFC